MTLVSLPAGCRRSGRAALVAGALGAVDLGVGVAQRGPDFIDFQLHDRALFAFFSVVAPGFEASADDDAGSLGEGFGNGFS